MPGAGGRKESSIKNQIPTFKFNVLREQDLFNRKKWFEIVLNIELSSMGMKFRYR